MEKAELAIALVVFALVFGYIFFSIGLDGFFGQEIPKEITNEISPQKNETGQNGTGEEKPANVCTTYWKNCPDGTTVRRVSCTSGAVSEEKCNLNPYGKNLTKLPSHTRYYGLFSCYWDVRSKYPYGDKYDPFTVCSQQITGWKESCECAEQIQKYVQENGKPKIS